jgi:hypothetical protein
MAILQNTINANSATPLPTLQGGTGLNSTTATAHGILVAEGASAFNPIVLPAGEILIGTTAGDPVASALTAGTGITITSVSGSITIANSAPAISWVDETSTSVTMVDNTGYTADAGASLVTFTLPTTAVAIGDTVEVQGKGSGLWKIAQSAGNQIFFGNQATTAGTGGSVASTLQYDAIKLRALTAGTGGSWSVVYGVGNFTVT